MNESTEREIIRQAGGIVHGDGNIFFTNYAQFLAAARASQSAPSPVEDKDGEELRRAVEVAAIRNAALDAAYDAMFDINGDKVTRFDAQVAIRRLKTSPGALAQKGAKE